MSPRKVSKSDRLDPYRAKRSAERTHEPFGTPGASRPQLFVVQKHAATKLHHDFRLEWGGTLWSWAIPHGPSLDPAEKRLAVHVEDHPVEYADFEGIIPKDNYGAGAVIVWDRGLWIPYDDPDVGIQEGKLHFELRGYKLRGVWTLIRLKGSGKDWLLIKKPDAHAAKEGTKPFDERSILSGLTLEELRDGSSRAADVRKQLFSWKATRTRVDVKKAGLMLAETGDAPFSSPDWLFELKYDGYRMLASRTANGVRLAYRSGGDVTSNFPELQRAMAALPFDNLILDGELVVLDEQGRPDFQRLQKRARLSRRHDIERATVELPVTLFLFDILAFEDFDLRGLPLEKRKSILRSVLPASGALRYADHVEARGEEMYEQVSRMGLEGIMAKKKASLYRATRSPQWLKLPADRYGDFVVIGFTEPQGSRPGVGALHLGVYAGRRLVYAGRVGTGMNDTQLEEMRRRLEPMRVAKPACDKPLPAAKTDTWVRPECVAEVRYKTWTEDGHLRHPVFLRLRDDRAPQDCRREDDGVAPEETEPPAVAPEPASASRTVRFTNLDKVFWPEERYTKGDLIEFYRVLAPWLLPYLEGRPLVVTRYPDGIEGKSFYQKNAPDYVPSWVRTQRVWSESAQREIDYFVCDSVEMLLYIINMGSIPLHVWSSRVAALQHPDWCILDLDPKGAPFEHVVQLALAIGDLCREIELPSFIKSSGSTGLHVLLPLGGMCTYDQSRQLAHLIARVIQEQHADIATIVRNPAARGGRVYLDYLQNRHGQLLASPFSVRPLPGAPVSTPLEWKEVDAKLDPKRFTIQTVPERVRKRPDPLLPVLSQRPDLVGALSRLAARLDAGAAPGAKRRARVSTAPPGRDKETPKPSRKRKPST